MEDKKPGAARNTDPSTAQDAASSVDATFLEMEVFRAIKRQGNQGATWYELYTLTGIALASISPRFRPLRDKGYIEVRYGSNGEVQKRSGASGRRQTVWYARDPNQPTLRYADKRMQEARARVDARRMANDKDRVAGARGEPR